MIGQDYLFNGLVQRGMPPHIAAGFVRNFQDESGLNPGINEVSPLVPGSRGGFGLSQWTGPRRRALEAYAAQRGVSVADPDLQLDFLMTELQGPESAAWGAIQQATTPEEAAAAIVNRFLRPAEAHRARREAEYLGGVNMPASGAPMRPEGPFQPQRRETGNALARPQLPQVGSFLDPAAFESQPMNALASVPQYRISPLSRRA